MDGLSTGIDVDGAAAPAAMVVQPDNGKCELLGPFALFVQGALGLLALGSLVWKRSRERPQRPLKIWLFDVSKQVVGSSMVHGANVLLALLSSGELSTEPPTPDGDEKGGGTNNPCSFYLLNILIDCTLGIFIIIGVVRITTKLLLLSNIRYFQTGIESGYYGNPPRYSWWIKQSLIYFGGLLGMKIAVYIIFAVFPWIGVVGDFLLAWTEHDKRLQVFFVMFFFPLVMNAFQYYVIDTFIKDNSHSGFVQVDGMDDESPRPSVSFRRLSDDMVYSSDDENFSPNGSLIPDPGHPNPHQPYGLRQQSNGRSFPGAPAKNAPTVNLPIGSSRSEYTIDSDDASSFQRKDALVSSSAPNSSVPLRNTRLDRNKEFVPRSQSSSMRLLPGSKGSSPPER